MTILLHSEFRTAAAAVAAGVSPPPDDGGTTPPLIRTRGDWRDAALCAQTDPTLFYPPNGAQSGDAKAVCAACPVADQCLRWALEHDERYGIWGGKTFRQRRELKRQQKLLTTAGSEVR